MAHLLIVYSVTGDPRTDRAPQIGAETLFHSQSTMLGPPLPRLRPIPVSSVAEISSRVSAAAVPRGSVAELHLIGHGSVNLLEIGRDVIGQDLATSDALIGSIANQLNPLLTKDALVVIHGCNSGGDDLLLQVFSSRFGNRSVLASPDTQLADTPGLDRNIRVCRGVSCYWLAEGF